MNGDIEQLSEAVQILKRELDQHRSAQFGLSRSNTCTPTMVGQKLRSPVLPAINPTISDLKATEMKSDLSKKGATEPDTGETTENNKFNNPPCIMFTKLDADRNKRRLKRAQARGILTDKSYEVKLVSIFCELPILFVRLMV